MSSGTFKDYYYLKEELVDFCKENYLQATGNKIELTDRIAHFLDTGERIKSTSYKGKNRGPVTEDTPIGEKYIYSEERRAFFKERLGNNFKFNVRFQKWLKANPDKTHKDALEAYVQLENDKDGNPIDKQFEYNTYIRAFFEDNKGKTLNDAIVCWRYKKGLRGHNRYEKCDLVALDLKE